MATLLASEKGWNLRRRSPEMLSICFFHPEFLASLLNLSGFCFIRRCKLARMGLVLSGCRAEYFVSFQLLWTLSICISFTCTFFFTGRGDVVFVGDVVA